MNGPGELQLSSETPDPTNCSLVSIIPIVGMSSCRGRAEAFARRLSSKLRTLGTQADETDLSPEDEPIINGGNTNTWVTGHEGGEQAVTNLQPLRHESDSFFDFDCELESPGSPVDECEYLRLIESTSNTPHNSAAESGYACNSVASSHSSSDGPYFDVNSENESCNILIQQQQLIYKPHSPQSQPQPPTEKDEVDFAKKVPPEITENGLHAEQCNGYQNHNDSVRQQNEESPMKTNEITTQTLPNEGPDIDERYEKSKQNHIQTLQNGIIIPSVQEKILQDKILEELHKQSQEYKKEDHAVEEEEEKMTEVVEKMKTEISLEKESAEEVGKEQKEMQIDVNTLINGHTEIGEDVLTIVVAEEDQKKTEIIENPSENKEEKEESENIPKECQPVQNLTESSIESLLKTVTDDVTTTINTSENIITALESENTKQGSTIPGKTTHLHMDTTDDEDDCRPQRVRRCSSLKTGKTPPGTPGRKKIVRFADVLGLDLADIKTFLDEIPTIPKSAYEDLEIIENEPPLQMGPKSNRLLMPLFQQPGGLPKFVDVVREKLVTLENAAVTDTINHTITGSVRVRNLDFHKSVHIRYTLDGWRSYADLQANYVEKSCDGFTDTFSFVLFGNSLHIGQRLEFAVRFQCKGQQYWDNNYGSNYCFQCLPTSSSAVTQAITAVLPSHHTSTLVGLLSPTVGDSWCTSFY